MNHVLAKKCQYILSDLEYRTYFHQWSCLPEENDVIHARKAQEILSDVCLSFIYIYIKQAGLEGTHQGRPVQLLALHRTPQKSHQEPEGIVQTLLNLYLEPICLTL